MSSVPLVPPVEAGARRYIAAEVCDVATHGQPPRPRLFLLDYQFLVKAGEWSKSHRVHFASDGMVPAAVVAAAMSAAADHHDRESARHAEMSDACRREAQP